MPAPYSYDLRRKVIEAIDGGMGKTEASKIFRISRNTINLWLQKREETGDYEAEDGYQRGYGAKIPDLEEFKQFARKHGSQTSIGNGGGMAKRNQRSNYEFIPLMSEM